MSPGMSQSTLERAPGTLQNVPKRPRVSDWAFANEMASKRSGTCLGRLYNGPKCPNVCTWLAGRVLMLPQVLVKIIPITSIANGVIVAISSLSP